MSDTTRLEPGSGDPVLAGAGGVRLTSQAFSRLGDFKNSFTNAAEHRIEGAGIVFGGLTNLGTVQADVPGAQLILFPPGQKRNHGEFRASNDATFANRGHDRREWYLPRGRRNHPSCVRRRVTEAAQLYTLSSITLNGAASSFNSSASAVSVGGDFDNRSTCPQCFEWLEGALRLIGLTVQTVEAAGGDVGPHVVGYTGNFALGRLEIAANAQVEVIDAFDNQSDGFPPGSGDEVLYVRTLALESGSRLEPTGSPVYYCELHNNGGSIPQLGKSVLRIQADANCDRHIDLVDYAMMYACLAGSPSPDCLEQFDMDDNTDIDLRDFARLQNAFAPK